MLNLLVVFAGAVQLTSWIMTLIDKLEGRKKNA